jgi:hypothetical protein
MWPWCALTISPAVSVRGKVLSMVYAPPAFRLLLLLLAALLAALLSALLAASSAGLSTIMRLRRASCSSVSRSIVWRRSDRAHKRAGTWRSAS